MLNNKGFDLWADGYDKSVDLSEESGEYPFAGYKEVLGSIYNSIRINNGKKILDIGFGTAVLSKRLYDKGYEIYGMDFSEKMIGIAKEKMPEANLIQHDFTNGFPSIWSNEKFDFIVCTYAIHHLEKEQQINFIKELIKHLSHNGKILIGDVAFETAREMEFCREKSGDDWDDEEIYPVAEVLKAEFSGMTFKKISFCSGVLEFGK